MYLSLPVCVQYTYFIRAYTQICGESVYMIIFKLCILFDGACVYTVQYQTTDHAHISYSYLLLHVWIYMYIQHNIQLVLAQLCIGFDIYDEQ